MRRLLFRDPVSRREPLTFILLLPFCLCVVAPPAAAQYTASAPIGVRTRVSARSQAYVAAPARRRCKSDQLVKASIVSTVLLGGGVAAIASGTADHGGRAAAGSVIGAAVTATGLSIATWARAACTSTTGIGYVLWVPVGAVGGAMIGAKAH